MAIKLQPPQSPPGYTPAALGGVGMGVKTANTMWWEVSSKSWQPKNCDHWHSDLYYCRPLPPKPTSDDGFEKWLSITREKPQRSWQALYELARADLLLKIEGLESQVKDLQATINIGLTACNLQRERIHSLEQQLAKEKGLEK